MKLLVFHIISKPDTEVFKTIYEDLPEVSVYINPRSEEVRDILKSNPGITAIFIGHGDNRGLYDQGLRKYVVDSKTVPLLQGRTVIGIWCYAAEFADINNLHGFFTSNFISNAEESCLECIPIGDEEINELNSRFAERVHMLLESDMELSLWVSELQSLARTQIEKYNYEALCYYEQ